MVCMCANMQQPKLFVFFFLYVPFTKNPNQKQQQKKMVERKCYSMAERRVKKKKKFYGIFTSESRNQVAKQKEKKNCFVRAMKIASKYQRPALMAHKVSKATGMTAHTGHFNRISTLCCSRCLLAISDILKCVAWPNVCLAPLMMAYFGGVHFLSHAQHCLLSANNKHFHIRSFAVNIDWAGTQISYCYRIIIHIFLMQFRATAVVITITAII